MLQLKNGLFFQALVHVTCASRVHVHHVTCASKALGLGLVPEPRAPCPGPGHWTLPPCSPGRGFGIRALALALALGTWARAQGRPWTRVLRPNQARALGAGPRPWAFGPDPRARAVAGWLSTPVEIFYYLKKINRHYVNYRLVDTFG